ncbi:MAG: alpha-hydroxy-acid oxidizing protein [Ekhidna sp.]|nr:alpha-hydroxy-acid oxidizing protein [Ekhidna sp.]
MWIYNKKYPSIEDLIIKAKEKIPKFAFEYLDGGCNEDVNLFKNTKEIRDVELVPEYISTYNESQMFTELFGITYDAPFGIAPVGLQGLMWPKAPEILAKAAHRHNIPFILSTVTTSSIETIAEITEGKSWFQLYHPAEDWMRDDIIKRVEAAGMPVLVILADVPTFGFRPRDIRNGLALPPEMSLNNIFQILGRPHWAVKTLLNGQPTFETLKPYTPSSLNLKQLGKFMDETFSGRLNEDRVRAIRDLWKGKLVLKGVANEEDVRKAVNLGVDGVIVSNHGGRQLDAGQSSIASSRPILDEYKDRITIMLDSGLRSGPDIARCLATGVDFTFLGRSFMYSVAALGEEGGDHMIGLLKTQLQQVMDQICCEKVTEFPKFLFK